MTKGAEKTFPVLAPDLQVSFYYRLGAIRKAYLRDALQATVAEAVLSEIDSELREFVPPNTLKRVASFGLRGEVFFAIPLLLRKDPLLLGYYRLLYGLSQKEFYNKGPFGRFKRMEDRGEFTTRIETDIHALCHSLAVTGSRLVDGIDELSLDVVHELQLLTVGPQFRGSENTRVGETAMRSVMDLIKAIVKPHIKEQTRRAICLENAAGRPVLIQFSSDPDVLITEKLEAGQRYVVSIEVKGGSDASNIHNRLGEAEKSHLKAKILGCLELWTIIRVEVPLETARLDSPTTTSFFNLDRILNKRTNEYREFRQALASRIGIRI